MALLRIKLLATLSVLLLVMAQCGHHSSLHARRHRHLRAHNATTDVSEESEDMDVMNQVDGNLVDNSEDPESVYEATERAEEAKDGYFGEAAGEAASHVDASGQELMGTPMQLHMDAPVQASTEAHGKLHVMKKFVNKVVEKVVKKFGMYSAHMVPEASKPVQKIVDSKIPGVSIQVHKLHAKRTIEKVEDSSDAQAEDEKENDQPEVEDVAGGRGEQPAEDSDTDAIDAAVDNQKARLVKEGGISNDNAAIHEASTK